jgi:hypothetical protein
MGSLSFGLPECIFFSPILQYTTALHGSSLSYPNLSTYHEELEETRPRISSKSSRHGNGTTNKAWKQKKMAYLPNSKTLQRDMEILCPIREEEEEEEAVEEEAERAGKPSISCIISPIKSR